MKRNKEGPGIQTVAKLAGVSASTVSRVYHNSQQVRPDVRQKVLEMAEKLGYTPSPIRVVPPIPALIAVVITDILNPYYSELIRGIQDEKMSEKIGLLLCDIGETQLSDKDFLQKIYNRQIDGMIICSSRMSNTDIISVFEQLSLPMVVLNREVNHPQIPCIRVDYEKSTYRAAHHLIDLGHTRIAYMAGPADYEPSLARKRGIQRALAETGLNLTHDFCPSGFPNVAGGFQVMSGLLSLHPEARPTAVLAYNDLMAIGALQAIRAHNLRIPEDISVVGFDDIDLAAHANPPLTTVDQPKYWMGKLAMRLLKQLFDKQSISMEGYTLLESPLVVRESSGPVPASSASGVRLMVDSIAC